MQQEILDIYSKTFARPEIIYNKLNKKYTLQQIKDVLKNIDTNQITGKKQENKDLEIPISAPVGSFQADLTFYNQFKRQNNCYSILLTIIEINTRYAYVYPLKDKKAQTILKCLEDLLSKEKGNLKSISFDAGSEFENKIIKDFLNKNNIEFIFFNKQTNPNSTMIKERFNRTIRDKISKYQSFKKQKNYIDNLYNLVNEYNNMEHSSIGMTPQKSKEENFSNTKARLQKQDILERVERELKIGDLLEYSGIKNSLRRDRRTTPKTSIKSLVKKVTTSSSKIQRWKASRQIDKEVKKTAQYLTRVKIFELIQNEKVKKEVSKKEVKQLTNLKKKMKREGINLLNTMEFEEFLEDNDIPIVQQEEQKSSIDKFIVAEALARENKIKEIKQEKERVERKSILDRSRSRDKSLKQKQIIKQTQQKLQETSEQTQKKELEAKINKLKQEEQINKKNLDKLDNTQMLAYQNEMKQNDFDKILEKTNHKEKDNLIKFLQIQEITKNSFKKPKNKDMSQAIQNIITIQNITHQQIHHELKQLQNQKQIVSKDSQEEIDEVADKNKQKAKELDSEIKQIKEQINKLKQQKYQFPDDEDVINREIQRLIEQKGLLKKEYEDLTGKQYLEHAEEKNVKKQIDSDQSEDDNQSNQTGQFYKMFNKFGKKN